MDSKNLVDEKEIHDLERRFGPLPRHTYLLEPEELSQDHWNNVVLGRRNRRGEVVLVIRRPGGRVLLHTKSFYPQGIYRLPTGGIHWEEPVLMALSREMAEETGLETKQERCLGILTYSRQNEPESQNPAFISYIFLLDAFRGRPSPQDPGERISSFRSVPVSALREVAGALRALPPEWATWGRFRALAHEIAADALGA